MRAAAAVGLLVDDNGGTLALRRGDAETLDHDLIVITRSAKPLTRRTWRVRTR